jgi:hypothetical protein
VIRLLDAPLRCGVLATKTISDFTALRQDMTATAAAAAREPAMV